MSNGASLARAFVSFVLLAGEDLDATARYVAAVDALLGQRFDRHEIVVVDNGGSDGVAERLTAPQEHVGNLIVLRLARVHDTESAMLAGLARAMGDFVFEAETVHLDWSPELLDELFRRCSSGIDIVDAANGEPSWTRRQVFDVINRFSYLEISDHPVGIRVVSRRALDAMLDMREKVRYRRALYAATGYPSEVIHYVPSTPGTVTQRGLAELVRRGFDVMVSFSELGLRLANLAAIGFACFAVVAFLYTIAIFVLKRDVATGWTTIMLVLSVGFAGLFIVLSLLGEYLSRILIEVRHRPPYAVRSVTVYPAQSQGAPLPCTPLDLEASVEDAVEEAAGG